MESQTARLAGFFVPSDVNLSIESTGESEKLKLKILMYILYVICHTSLCPIGQHSVIPPPDLGIPRCGTGSVSGEGTSAVVLVVVVVVVAGVVVVVE